MKHRRWIRIQISVFQNDVHGGVHGFGRSFRQLSGDFRNGGVRGLPVGAVQNETGQGNRVGEIFHHHDSTLRDRVDVVLSQKFNGSGTTAPADDESVRGLLAQEFRKRFAVVMLGKYNAAAGRKKPFHELFVSGRRCGVAFIGRAQPDDVVAFFRSEERCELPDGGGGIEEDAAETRNFAVDGDDADSEFPEFFEQFDRRVTVGSPDETVEIGIANLREETRFVAGHAGEEPDVESPRRRRKPHLGKHPDGGDVVVEVVAVSVDEADQRDPAVGIISECAGGIGEGSDPAPPDEPSFTDEPFERDACGASRNPEAGGEFRRGGDLHRTAAAAVDKPQNVGADLPAFRGFYFFGFQFRLRFF